MVSAATAMLRPRHARGWKYKRFLTVLNACKFQISLPGRNIDEAASKNHRIARTL